jgi:hypothetical protein
MASYVGQNTMTEAYFHNSILKYEDRIMFQFN